MIWLAARRRTKVSSYFKDYRESLAVLFENRQCAECGRFHRNTLNHPDVVDEMQELSCE